MSPSTRIGLRAASCVAALLVWTTSLVAATEPRSAASKSAGDGGKPVLRMFDVRVSAGELAKALADPNHVANRTMLNRTAIEARAAAMRTGLARLRQEAPGATLKISQTTVAPSSVLGGRKPLTAAAAGASSEDIVRGFLGAHADIYGLSAADLGDLVVLGDSPGGRSGLRMLRMEQQLGGRPIFQSETRFLLDREGRLQRTLGQMVPNARALAPAIDRSRLLSAPEAVARLLASVGKTGAASAFTVSKTVRPGTFELDETDDYVAGAITAHEVLFPLAPGVLVPAWSLVVSTGGDEDWYAMVDAETGGVLWRKNIRESVSTHDARFRVYVQADGVTPADSPAPQSPNTVVPGSGTQFAEITPTIVTMFTAQAAVPGASPNGWIDDCPAGVCGTVDTNTSTEQTVGNNVRACMDRTIGGAATNQCDINTTSQLDTFGKPRGNPDTNGRNRDFLGTAPRDFETNFLPPPQGGAGGGEVGQDATGAGNGTSTGPTDIFRRGSVTQHFYSTNWYHDQLFQYGFDEASANFQNTNFSGMGLGGDRVLMDVQDGSGTNNANFATPPDGTSGRSQMFRFTTPIIDRDGGLDTEILIHELTHGTSNRLVGNAAGLNWDTARGMGEGWSDFYALAMLNNTNADDPDGQYGSGAYATYKFAGLLDNYLYGIRRFPYSTDNTVNPLTWADVDDVTNALTGGIATSPINFNGAGAHEVHNSGELWALSLWEVRSRIIADPAGANGDVPTGNQTMLNLVTDGLKMTPIDPNYLDAREAILDADCATNACANEDSIWGGFADRGLGYDAREPYHIMGRFVRSHIGLRESFSPPFLDVVDDIADVAINDTASNNNGDIDPGEVVLLTVTLTNPWRAAGKAVTSATATLSTTTTGITIFDNTAAYGAIAPQGSAAGSDSFLITVDATVVCGSAIDFTLATTSNLGTTSTTFRARIGNPNGTDAVVTYTGDPSPDLAIVDNQPRGTLHQISVTDDFEIADLDLRIDSVTHTFPGDVTALLRSPGGIGTDFIALIGGVIGEGFGPNMTNMVIDDDLVSSVATDMTQAPDTSAPYTASWLPVSNGPWIPLFGLTSDPVPNLSLYDGTSTLGTWSIIVADNFNLDSGSLNAWSMLVTPRHFDCTAFAASAIVSATKTVAGAFTVGGTVTYTVVLTNTGTDAQGDNAGNEFTDLLPASLTLVSAVATSGTATANVNPNEVTWNGTLAPLGGSVTITITATINAGTQGTTISNQGITSFDGNNDNVNEAAGVTDDPGVGGAIDPTGLIVGSANLTATKTVSGSFNPGGAVVYTIVISNSGSSASPDNAGDEFTDVLSASLTLVSASATAGTPLATIATNTVTWNGSVPAAGSVTITINATILTAGATISNQGTVNFDADLNGTNETSILTDDPALPGGADPTTFQATAIVEIPTLSELGLLAMVLALIGAAWVALRRRQATS